jgi:hypothetical protein
MKSTTLLDFEDGGLPEAMEFYLHHRRLPPCLSRRKLEETYGNIASRDQTLRARVNEITLLYLEGMHNRKDYGEGDDR